MSDFNNLDDALDGFARDSKRAEERSSDKNSQHKKAPPIRKKTNINNKMPRQTPQQRPQGVNSAPSVKRRPPESANGGYGIGANNNRGVNPSAKKPPVKSVKKENTANTKSEKNIKAQKTPKNRKPVSPRTRRVLVALAAVFCIGVLTVGIIGGYTFIFMAKSVNGDIIIDLDTQTANQSKTSIIYGYDSNGKVKELTRLHGQENRIWVDLDTIPKNLQNAYIALEDKRFKKHHGVDWIRTVGVIVKEHFSQGGSTITQQLIKNLTGENGRTFSRKFYEIIRALNLEKHYDKDRIIEAYLNTLYLDAGCYGVETAAEYYFGKEVKDLNLAECASIAAITQEPRTYNPILNFEENRSRQRMCLDMMLEQGLITEEECKEAKDYELVLNTGENKIPLGSLNNDNPTDEPDDTDEYQSYYVDFVIDTVIKDLMQKYDITSSVAWRQVYYGGLSIYTAVDLDIQKQMEEVYYNRISFPDDEDIQSAMTVMDYNGRVCGIVGQAGPKPGNRCLNMAADSPRQPGSSIKPLSVYAPSINENLATYSSKIKNYGIKEIDGDIWPYNYGGDPGSPYSYKTVQQAIAPSLNTVAAQLLEKLTIDTSIKYLTDNFHLSHIDSKDSAYSPLATGGMTYGTTTLEMAAAYAVFGNGGKYYKPYCYYNVKNSKGEIILENNSSKYEQAVDPGTADVMNKLMQTVVTASDGTARKFRIDDQVLFAKTGTTTDNYDSWFCGGTPYYVSSVWVGYRQNRELKNIGGNSPSGKIFQEVFNRIHSGLEEKEFEMSEDCVKRTYCRGSGKLASSTCTDTAVGWYKEDNIPGYCTNCSVYGDVADTPSTSDDVSSSVTSVPSSNQPKPTTPNNDPPTTAKPTQPPTTVPPPTVAPPEEPDADDDR